MPTFFYNGELLQNSRISLSEEESLHCIKVLRLQQRDNVKILNGKGQIFNGLLSNISKKKVEVELLEPQQVFNRKYFLHIAIAPTKSADKIEWFIEKAVEIGIDKISFFYSKYSERKKLRTDRIKRRAISALKQSGNPILPEINELTSFEKTFENIKEDQRFIAFEKTKPNDSLLKQIDYENSYFVLIGPEGGFNKKEVELAIENGCQTASLANYVLRTETAGVATCSMLNAVHLK